MIFGNLIVAFVTGLISSVGHCLGMCGGIVAIYSARRPALAGANPGFAIRVASLLPVHVGRITTYALLGAAVGAAGAILDQVSGLAGWQGAFSILVGGVMLLIGLSLLGVLPPIEVALASLTGSPMRRMKGLFGSSSAWSSLALGLLWGLLPCGLVFAMLMNAASTATPWDGALTMIAFGLGTIPTLLGFGLASGALAPQLRGRLMQVAALIIFFFGAQMILRGLAAMHIIPSLILGPVMLW
ncbi:MAG: sulfite exporter TauE/SafE family protein [Anaerolineales bacterium]|nr:sulfite exporter TauE/SafE family protein [Anaerolineales bacterium]